MKFREKYSQCKTWRSKARCIHLLHSIKSANDKEWIMSDTARFFDVSIATVSESIFIAEHMSLLSNAKSRAGALRILRSK
jgi:hypothetical protein